MKFHWGHGIFLFYVIFVAALVTVVIASRQFDNSLVTEEYYARDLNYQQEYDRRMNSSSLTEPLSIMRVNGEYQLLFPKGKNSDVEGTVLLYRPSSKHDDRLVKLSVGAGGTMQLPTNGLKPGRYQAVVEWSANGIDYFDELDLNL